MISKLLADFLNNLEEKIIHTYLAPLYDYLVRKRLAPVHKNLPLISLMQNKIVLDLGCGTAHLAIKLTELSNKLFIIGLDISKSLLRVAQRRAKAEGLQGERLCFVCADAHFLPLPDSSVDFIISTGSLHHWDDVPRVLNEIFRILKPNGQARIYDQRRFSSLREIKNIFFVHKFLCLGLSALPDKKIKEYLEKSSFANYEFIKDGASIEIRAFKSKI